MGLLGKIAPEHRQSEADNIEKSLVRVKESGDSLRAMAASVEQRAARLDQLSLISLTSNSTSQALFESIRSDHFFYSKLVPVIESVQAGQQRIVGIREQHGLDKSRREDQQSGDTLAKSSMLIASNVRSTLENCLGKKAELEGTAIAPLKEKVYEAFSMLNLPEGDSITSVQALMQLQEIVEQQVQIFSWQFERNLKEGQPNSADIDLGESLIVSHTESQAQKMDALRSSLSNIQKCVDHVSSILEESNSRVLALDLRLNQLEDLGKGLDSSRKVLGSAYHEEKQLAITSKEQFAILVKHKNQVEEMLAEQRLPKESRPSNGLNGAKRMKLAAEAAQYAEHSKMVVIKASNLVSRSENDLIEKIENVLVKLDAPITARAVNETGAVVARRGHYGRSLSGKELKARNALEDQVREGLKALQ